MLFFAHLIRILDIWVVIWVVQRSKFEFFDLSELVFLRKMRVNARRHVAVVTVPSPEIDKLFCNPAFLTARRECMPQVVKVMIGA